MKKIIFLSLFSTIIFLSGLTHAAQVDVKKSYIQWTGSKLGGSFHTGKFYLKEAHLKEEAGKITGATLIVDIASMTDEDLTDSEKHDKFLNHMKSPDFFDVAQYPTATIELTSITDAAATGFITLKDKKEPITLTYTKNGNLYNGTTTINRTKHGMTYNSQNFFKDLVADKVIKDDVKIDFTLVVQ